MSMASKEAVADVLDGDSRPEVAFKFRTILGQFSKCSMSSTVDFLSFWTFANEMSTVSL